MRCYRCDLLRAPIAGYKELDSNNKIKVFLCKNCIQINLNRNDNE